MPGMPQATANGARNLQAGLGKTRGCRMGQGRVWAAGGTGVRTRIGKSGRQQGHEIQPHPPPNAKLLERVSCRNSN